MKENKEEFKYRNAGIPAVKLVNYKGFDLVNFNYSGRSTVIFDSITGVQLAIANSKKEAKMWIDNNYYYPAGMNK